MTFDELLVILRRVPLACKKLDVTVEDLSHGVEIHITTGTSFLTLYGPDETVSEVTCAFDSILAKAVREFLRRGWDLPRKEKTSLGNYVWTTPTFVFGCNRTDGDEINLLETMLTVLERTG